MTEFRLSKDLSRVPLKVSQIDQNIDRSTYILMKNCETCGTVIGKTGLKKFYCKFCFKAFCAACLTLTGIHPETKNPEKICFNCYVHFVKINVVEAAGEYVEHCLQQEIKMKEKARNHTFELTRKLENLKEEKKKNLEAHSMNMKLKTEFLSFLIQKYEEIDLEVGNSADYLFSLFENIAKDDQKSTFDRFLENLVNN
jgi:hypothetical protein